MTGASAPGANDFGSDGEDRAGNEKGFAGEDILRTGGKHRLGQGAGV